MFFLLLWTNRCHLFVHNSKNKIQIWLKHMTNFVFQLIEWLKDGTLRRNFPWRSKYSYEQTSNFIEASRPMPARSVSFNLAAWRPAIPNLKQDFWWHKWPVLPVSWPGEQETLRSTTLLPLCDSLPALLQLYLARALCPNCCPRWLLDTVYNLPLKDHYLQNTHLWARLLLATFQLPFRLPLPFRHLLHRASPSSVPSVVTRHRMVNSCISRMCRPPPQAADLLPALPSQTRKPHNPGSGSLSQVDRRL